MKYQIGQKYLLNVFMDAEEMEYLGEITTKHLNGSRVEIRFDVFRRMSYGRPDLIATYNDEFFARTHDDTVEGLTKAVGNMFWFKGKGYTHIMVGDIKLTIDDFREQTKDILTEEEIAETISIGRYYMRHKHYNKNYGEVKWCPKCGKIRQTSCSACGCGHCETCKYRWICNTNPFPTFIKISDTVKTFKFLT